MVKTERLTHEKAISLVAAGLQRAVATHGKRTVAYVAGSSERRIEAALSHTSLPHLDILLNILDLDQTVLDELLAFKGVRISPLHPEPGNDLSTAAGVISAMGNLVRANVDGPRCHNQTLAIAALLRPHAGAIEAIIHEADQLRGAA